MYWRSLIALSTLAVTAAIAGCGASSNTSSTSGVSAPAQPASASSSTGGQPYGQYRRSAVSAAPVITTKHSAKLGTILAAGSKKLTVYLFEGDTRAGSSCTGACASVWPPVIGPAKAVAAAMSSELGTITRPDGRKQVTYNGHPLYLYVRDKDGEDAYGEGIKSFGAEWYALSPSGNKVDVS